MVTLVAAVARNGCIGKDGALPWRIPADVQHYKDVTMGKVVIMGRKTWESIPVKYRPLPGRTNVVVTRQSAYQLPGGVERFGSLVEALAAHAADDVVINGGAEIYRAAIGRADRLDITHVDRDVDGDTFFPPIDPTVWNAARREDHDGFSFVLYERA